MTEASATGNAMGVANPPPSVHASSVDVAELFRAHGPFLLAAVARMSGPGPHVEDIVQEVFVTALNKRQQLVAGAHVRGWLYRTASHLVRHRWRSGFRWRSFTDRFATHTPLVIEPPATERVDDEHSAERVWRVLQRLPHNQREVVMLYELEELSGQDIAKLLAIPENTVWSRLRLGRERFRQHWFDGGVA